MKRMNIAMAAVLLLVSGTLPANSEMRCAKDMFFDQLESPKESINTGLKYWIQLRRNGKLSLVDKVQFSAGDEIRFLLVPNINGYAYVVLEKGSTGKRKILFPNTYEPSGKVLSGKQILLPARGYLKFDRNPGVETVRIVVSRKPVSEKVLLEDDAKNKIMVASSTAADAPVQNQNCLLAFSRAENKTVDFESDESKSLGEYSKDLNYVPGTAARRSSSKLRIRIPRRKPSGVARKSAKVEPAYRPGSVTVINLVPGERLLADIELKHI
jgi:hypothetical protein